MDKQPEKASKSLKQAVRPPFECIALVLQGGGALGAYQAGVFEALVEAQLEPDWIAGISIGAVNGAIIAGNPPERRVERLHQFWNEITTDLNYDLALKVLPNLFSGDLPRAMYSRLGSGFSLALGQQGFFKPRLPPPIFHFPGALAATSFYETSELEATLSRLVDFDRINSGPMRLSVGAVNVRTGNFIYFDSTSHKINPRHIIASASLPPGFPATEIEGEFYWDGGLVSNTPLQWILEEQRQRDTLAFQVDLWSAYGAFPRDIPEVMEREKEIRYSSRTRLNTDQFRRMQKLRRTLARLLDKLPPEFNDDADVALLKPAADTGACNIVHLIYHSKSFEDQAKDYEFSRTGMTEHWQAGHYDAVATLRHKQIFERPTDEECVRVFDFSGDGQS